MSRLVSCRYACRCRWHPTSPRTESYRRARSSLLVPALGASCGDGFSDLDADHTRSRLPTVWSLKTSQVHWSYVQLRQKEPVAYGGDRDQANLCVLFASL